MVDENDAAERAVGRTREVQAADPSPNPTTNPGPHPLSFVPSRHPSPNMAAAQPARRTAARILSLTTGLPPQRFPSFHSGG